MPCRGDKIAVGTVVIRDAELGGFKASKIISASIRCDEGETRDETVVLTLVGPPYRAEPSRLFELAEAHSVFRQGEQDKQQTRGN